MVVTGGMLDTCLSFAGTSNALPNGHVMALIDGIMTLVEASTPLLSLESNVFTVSILTLLMDKESSPIDKGMFDANGAFCAHNSDEGIS